MSKFVRAVGDSPPQVICDAPEGRGGTWNRAGVIVFCPAIGSTLHRVSASGGQPTPLTKLDPSRHEDAHYWPQFLPDGKRFLYFARSTEPQNSMIVAGTLQGDSPPEPLVKSVVMGVYANPGYLITVTEGALAAQRLDPRRLALTGEPVVIAVGVGAARNVGRPSFTVSENGVLAYRPSGTQERRLTWLGRQGQTLGVVGTPDAYGGFRLSPDQGRLAVEIFDSRRNSGDIWLMDLGRGVSSRFAFSTRDNQWPVWSPAADWIAFLSDRTAPANLYRKATSGAGHEERLLEKNRVQFTNDWSFDGRYLLYQERSPNAGWDLWMVPMTGVRNAAPFLAKIREEEKREIEQRSTYTDEKSGAVRHFKLNASTLETIHKATAEKLAAFDMKFAEEESRRIEAMGKAMGARLRQMFERDVLEPMKQSLYIWEQQSGLQDKIDDQGRSAAMAAVDQRKNLQLAQLDTVDARTLQSKVALENAKTAIEIQAVKERTKIELEEIDVRTERQVDEARKAAMAQGIFDETRLGQITSKINELGQHEKDTLQKSATADIDVAQLKGATATRKLVTDQYQSIFQSLKQVAGGVFDALVTKSQSVWSAIGNSLKTAMLTAIKDIATSRVAAMLMNLFVPGANVQMQPGGSGGEVLPLALL